MSTGGTTGNKGGRPLSFKSAEELQSAIDAYFFDCEIFDDPLTITGLALALKVNRLTLQRYSEADNPTYAHFLDIITEARIKCENYAEKRLFVGSNAAGPIFALKNYGWSDRQDINLSGDPEAPMKWEIEVVHKGRSGASES